MEVQQILHMKGGDGDSSYANNSLLQKNSILKAEPIVQASIKEVYYNGFPECIKIADMGCSSGPNTFLPIFEMIESIKKCCNELNHKPPMLQVFLNDLPTNDFNTVFKSLPSFYDQLERHRYLKDNSITNNTDSDFPCFVAGVPGSFYGRLFPDRSLHFVHSSYSLHWLSQVPKGLVSESRAVLNKGSIYIVETSTPGVHKAYLDQFQTDFTLFLKSRGEEIISGGRIVLSFVSNNDLYDGKCDNYRSNIWEPHGMILTQMVQEGLIEEETLDTFNVPIYYPCVEDARLIVEKEGSFKIHELETYQIKWDGDLDLAANKNLVAADLAMRAKRVAKQMKAVGESLFASHFGQAVTDSLFNRLADQLIDYIRNGQNAVDSARRIVQVNKRGALDYLTVANRQWFVSNTSGRHIFIEDAGYQPLSSALL